MPADERLDRLLDYTKFHLGIYLTAAAGLVSIVAAAAGQSGNLLPQLVAKPWLLAVSALLMGVAGMAGGIIASSCTQVRTFDELWSRKQGPHEWKWLEGRHWALIEHASFWASFVLAAFNVLLSKKVWEWLFP